MSAAVQVPVATATVLTAASPSAWLATHLAARYDATEDPRWWTLRDLLVADAAALRALHTRLCVRDGVPPRAAANYLAAWVGGALADAIGFSLATAEAGFVAHPAHVRWRREPEGWIDGIDLGAPQVLVGSGHRWAGQPGVEVVADPAKLRTRTVAALVEVLRPVIDALHGLARVGRVGLWNEVGDGLGMALAFQRRVPALPELVDTLAAAVRTPGAPWRARPSLRIADSHIGAVYVGQKGGCCLAYTRAPDEPQYCSTCRFRTPDDCQARQLRWLERQPPTPDPTP